MERRVDGATDGVRSRILEFHRAADTISQRNPIRVSICVESWRAQEPCAEVRDCWVRWIAEVDRNAGKIIRPRTGNDVVADKGQGAKPRLLGVCTRDENWAIGRGEIDESNAGSTSTGLSPRDARTADGDRSDAIEPGVERSPQLRTTGGAHVHEPNVSTQDVARDGAACIQGHSASRPEA